MRGDTQRHLRKNKMKSPHKFLPVRLFPLHYFWNIGTNALSIYLYKNYYYYYSLKINYLHAPRFSKTPKILKNNPNLHFGTFGTNGTDYFISATTTHTPHKPHPTAYYRNTAVLSNTVWLSPYPKTNTSPKTSKIGETQGTNPVLTCLNI
jgi:hypothetical protein